MALFRARGHYENFPVASVLLPREFRPHIAAVYAFARTADDFADEGARAPEERLELLDSWEARLRAAAEGRGAGRPLIPGEPADTAALFEALGRTMRLKSLPVEMLADLLSAFRQDVVVHRYATWTDLLDYCRRSANPVGRIVLRIAGLRDPRLDVQSDAICTALQLTNFWQDLKVDFERGRVYVPGEELRAEGAHERELACGVTPAWRRVLQRVVGRTRGLFEDGRPLCDAVQGRLRYELRATWLGGIRILDRLEAAGLDPLTRRPVLGPPDVAWVAWHLLAWRSASRTTRTF